MRFNLNLTAGDRQVIRLVAQARSNKEIAAVLRLHEQTVKNRLTRVYDKTGQPTRTALALWAIRHSLEEENS